MNRRGSDYELRSQNRSQPQRKQLICPVKVAARRVNYQEECAGPEPRRITVVKT